MTNTNIIAEVFNNIRSFLKKEPLIRIVKEHNSYEVQCWDYDNLDTHKAWGKCWNTIYIKRSLAEKINIARCEGFAFYLSKEKAKAIKKYFKSNPDEICLGFSIKW